jgi:hypothetical protein
METTIPTNDLQVKYAGLAVECGTLTILLETLAITRQQVMVMPLERSVRRDLSTVHQWVVHVTTRTNLVSPVYFATLRAAEVVQRATGVMMTMPAKADRPGQTMRYAQHLQRQLYSCVIDLLSRSSQVSQIVTPARYCIPDEWVWSAQCHEPRLQCVDGSWVLVQEQKPAR